MMVKNEYEDLYLLFPQWQGSGRTNELYTGAMSLYHFLEQVYPFVEVKVRQTEALNVQQNIIGYAQIIHHLQDARSLLLRRNPRRIFSIGGDCGIEVAPVSFLNRQYDGDLALIWLDAHPDLNTPQMSPSSTFHGMVLRTLVGDGDPEIASQMFSSLLPRQIFLAGARDFDPSELHFIEQHGICSFTCDQLTHTVDSLIDAIQAQGFTNIYLHIDVDLLDPASFPSVKHPTPDGLSVATLLQIREALMSKFVPVGGSVVEFTLLQEGTQALEQLAALYGYPPLYNFPPQR